MALQISSSTPPCRSISMALVGGLLLIQAGRSAARVIDNSSVSQYASDFDLVSGLHKVAYLMGLKELANDEMEEEDISMEDMYTTGAYGTLYAGPYGDLDSYASYGYGYGYGEESNVAYYGGYPHTPQRPTTATTSNDPMPTKPTDEPLAGSYGDMEAYAGYGYGEEFEQEAGTWGGIDDIEDQPTADDESGASADGHPHEPKGPTTATTSKDPMPTQPTGDDIEQQPGTGGGTDDVEDQPNAADKPSASTDDHPHGPKGPTTATTSNDPMPTQPTGDDIEQEPRTGGSTDDVEDQPTADNKPSTGADGHPDRPKGPTTATTSSDPMPTQPTSEPLAGPYGDMEAYAGHGYGEESDDVHHDGHSHGPKDTTTATTSNNPMPAQPTGDDIEQEPGTEGGTGDVEDKPTADDEPGASADRTVSAQGGSSTSSAAGIYAAGAAAAALTVMVAGFTAFKYRKMRAAAAGPAPASVASSSGMV